MPEPWRSPDPGYEARIRDSFGRQSHMDTLGVSIAHVAPGEVHLSLPYSPKFCQQNGYMHADAIASAEVFTADAPERTLIATMLSTIIVRPVVA